MSLLEGIGKVPTSSLAISVGACIGGGIVGGFIMKRSAKTTDPTPEKWIKVGEIKELNIYPVKSMLGMSVNEAVVARLGLQGPNNPLLRDRVFAAINSEGKCLSQKQCPMFAFVQAKIDGNQLILTHIKDSSMNITIDIPTGVDAKKDKLVTVMGEKLRAVDCGDKVAAWLTKLTEMPNTRLVYHLADEPQRVSVKRNEKFHTYRDEHTGTFQDETSYMLMTDESLAAVNAEMAKPVTHKNFRPSIIANGLQEPFLEDFFGFIRIGGEGGSILKASVPCQRCTLTTIDPETGTIRTDGEPLKTLYRLKRQVGDTKISKLVGKSAILGAHFGCFEGTGSVIQVGQPIYAALL